MRKLFFGVGTGRVATMTMANALNCENNCVCLHEGKFREFEDSGNQLLPFLTLQNRIAYENPEKALTIVDEMRSNVSQIAESHDVSFFGDIAYNNSPIIAALHTRYPSAKFIYLFRDCLEFLCSCTAIDSIDETPVGWPPLAFCQKKIHTSSS